MKALVGTFNQEKALVGALSVIVKLYRLIVCSTMPDWLPCCRLLFRHFSQRQEVLRSFGQVQLLVSDSDVKSYKQIKDDLDDLRLLVEKSELWVYKAVKQEDKKVGDEKLYWTRFAVK